ncbi:hypothetical protein [Flaviaesturariibacter amylovorans]|uniref:Uncharacterized protein n=1 Tax=Flaviaesturariibacter amylovorans TaxID=1084520 RepID=A0ABP8GNU7_9BACT
MTRILFQLLVVLLITPEARAQQAGRTAFPMQLTVTAITVRKQLDAQGQVQLREVTEERYSVPHGLQLNRSLLNRMQAGTQRLDVCTSEQMCVLLSGSSNALGERQAVDYRVSRNTWTRCDDELVKTAIAEGNGTLKDYTLSSVVSVLRRPPAGWEPDPVSLVRNRADLSEIESVPLVHPERYIRLFVAVGGITPNINAAAPKLAVRTYDCNSKQWTAAAPEKYGLSVPDYGVLTGLRRNRNDNGMIESYIHPVFPEKELLRFLNDGKGGQSFTLKARSCSHSEGEEQQTDLYIELAFK